MKAKCLENVNNFDVKCIFDKISRTFDSSVIIRYNKLSNTFDIYDDFRDMEDGIGDTFFQASDWFLERTK